MMPYEEITQDSGLCPKCGSTWSWLGKDQKYVCQKCNTRYSRWEKKEKVMICPLCKKTEEHGLEAVTGLAVTDTDVVCRQCREDADIGRGVRKMPERSQLNHDTGSVWWVWVSGRKGLGVHGTPLEALAEATKEVNK